MNLQEFINTIIDDGIEASKADYSKEDVKHLLCGSIEGFESCRHKTVEEILELYKTSLKERNDAYWIRDDVKDYWRVVSKNSEIEWTLNCISAILLNEGKEPLLSHHPTARAVMKAFKVLEKNSGLENKNVSFAGNAPEEITES